MRNLLIEILSKFFQVYSPTTQVEAKHYSSVNYLSVSLLLMVDAAG